MTRGGRIDGVVLLDKPVGMTSNAALQAAKRVFRARKAGHTGSLDPLASGLLPLCFGEATKFSHYLLDSDKRYAVTACLGAETDTGDADGQVTRTAPVPVFDDARLESVLERYRGDILQVPPMYSALKHQGERLYDLARQGITVERAARPVTIRELACVARRPDALDLVVACTKGTYVRTLVEDIGRDLGCGAHVVALRRTGLGPFADPSMVTLDALEAVRDDADALAAWLLPVDATISSLPRCDLSRDAAFYLRRGQPVRVAGVPPDGEVRLYDEAGFVGVGALDAEGRVAPRRLVVAAG